MPFRLLGHPIDEGQCRRGVIRSAGAMKQLREIPPNMAYLFYMIRQGLLRELYKVQGHSSSGTTEWDWTKFEAQPGLGGVGSDAGEVNANIACEGNSTPIKACETPQVPAMWQALPVEAKAAIKANVRHL